MVVNYKEKFALIIQNCTTFMEKQLDPCNCLGMKAFAESHGLEKLAADAEKMILQKFMELVEYEEFLTMPKGKRSKNKKLF